MFLQKKKKKNRCWFSKDTHTLDCESNQRLMIIRGENKGEKNIYVKRLEGVDEMRGNNGILLLAHVEAITS